MVWPSGKTLSGGASDRIRFGSLSPFSSKVGVCGHCLVTLSLAIYETKTVDSRALIAAHLNAEVTGGESVAIGI